MVFKIRGREWSRARGGGQEITQDFVWRKILQSHMLTCTDACLN